ncbi:MAG: polyprenyl synthetase family protein [Hyphomicrobiaceae bacterium]|nr:polyprenyl synthetase family protein [Hyphomicrobiaceae bacterium]
MDFEQRLNENARLVTKQLGQHLMPGQHFGPPRTLADAMQHAVMSGGKRLRPFLMIEAARMFGRAPGRTIDAACALELIHCYSLVHDDLPAMDDDDLRRGKPTVHKAYDEATAILAGDALQSLAFEILAHPGCHANPTVRAQLVLELATASGWAGMAGGQMMDLEEEGKGGKTRLAVISRIHTMKTGKLIEFACVAGGHMAEVKPEEIDMLRSFGQLLGLMYQAADDILDTTASSDDMGKTAGKDEASGKATVVARMGLDKAKSYVATLEEEALKSLSPFGERAEYLIAATRFVAAQGR